MSKLVIIDAGHNKYTQGKASPDNAYKEYEFNLDLKDRMTYHLNRHGIMTLFVDSQNSNSSKELSEIVSKANNSKGDIYISIHTNAYSSSWNSASGWEIYCYGTNKNSEGYKLAKCIHDASIPTLGIKDRGIKDGSHLYVISKTSMPAVLIEHGFHTNKEEVKKLSSPEFRELCAICNTKGILSYFGMKYKEEKSKLYKVQVGAYKNKENAIKLANHLKSLGFGTFIVEE